MSQSAFGGINHTWRRKVGRRALTSRLSGLIRLMLCKPPLRSIVLAIRQYDNQIDRRREPETGKELVKLCEKEIVCAERSLTCLLQLWLVSKATFRIVSCCCCCLLLLNKIILSSSSAAAAACLPLVTICSGAQSGPLGLLRAINI